MEMASLSSMLPFSSTCPNADDTPLTGLRMIRIDLVPMRRDSIHSRISRSDALATAVTQVVQALDLVRPETPLGPVHYRWSWLPLLATGKEDPARMCKIAQK